jgi:hypothetical protein
MALKRELDTLDGLNEVVAGEYVKGTDGKFRLNLEGEDPSVAALNESRSTIATLNSTLEELKQKQIPDGVDVAALQAAQAELEKLKKTKPTEGDDSSEVTRLAEQVKVLEERLAADVQAEKDKGLTYLETHKTHLKENAAREALRRAGCKDPDKLLPHFLPHLDVKQEGETFTTGCVKGGKELFSEETPSKPMSPLEFVYLNFVKRWPDDFDTDVKFGTGLETTDTVQGVPGGAIVITKEQGKDTKFYREKRKEAADKGVEFIVQ